MTSHYGKEEPSLFLLIKTFVNVCFKILPKNKWHCLVKMYIEKQDTMC